MMICPKCSSDGVLNTILGKDFYYCRSCKVEIEVLKKMYEKERYVRIPLQKGWPTNGEEEYS